MNEDWKVIKEKERQKRRDNQVRCHADHGPMSIRRYNTAEVHAMHESGYLNQTGVHTVG